jgi:ankyrin repeat protein
MNLIVSFIAAKKGRKHIVEYLLSKDAKTNIKNKEGNTALNFGE